MELIKGFNLFYILNYNIDNDPSLTYQQREEIIKMRKELTDDVKLNLAQNILNAVDQLHKEYQLHSYDIKLENTILYKDEKDNLLKIKLIDFDNAYLIGSEEEKYLNNLKITAGYYFKSYGEIKYGDDVDKYLTGITILNLLSFNVHEGKPTKRIVAENCKDKDSNYSNEEDKRKCLYYVDLIKKRYSAFKNEKNNILNKLSNMLN